MNEGISEIVGLPDERSRMFRNRPETAELAPFQYGDAGFQYGYPRWMREKSGQVMYALPHDAGFDHPRTYKKKILLLQPYHATDGMAEAMIYWREKFHAHTLIISESGYWPGLTCSIIVSREQDKSLAMELTRKIITTAHAELANLKVSESE